MEQDSKFQANSSQADNMQTNVSQMSNSLENNSQGKVPFISKLAYGLGDVGCNFSWMFVGNFLMIFYTDVFGISMSAVATLMLCPVSGTPSTTPSSAHLPIKPTPDGDDSAHGCSSELLSRHWY